MISRWSITSVPDVASTARALADIQRAAPTDSEDGIAARFQEQVKAGAYPLDRWLGRDAEHTLEISASLSADRIPSARVVVRPVTTSTLLAPRSASTPGTSLTLPGTKTYVARDCEIEANHRYQSESSGDVLT
jgi:hypothetical protein